MEEKCTIITWVLIIIPFNYGAFIFIGLNSVEFEDLWYYGRIDSIQLEWLKKDVATVSPATPIITFQHIPCFSGGFSMMPFEEDGPGRKCCKRKRCFTIPSYCFKCAGCFNSS